MYVQQKKGVDGFVLAAVALVIFIGFSLVVENLEGSSGQVESTEVTPVPVALNVGGQGLAAPTRMGPGLTISADSSTLAAPYDEYILTQGQHGFSYGHAAIDISGGKGAPIKSPIEGVVSENYVDQYGNPTLILNNDRYTVTFLHGNYTVRVGDRVTIGQQVGTESNKGYTMDMQGRLCTNRDCGYHSHLNVFDKQLGSNINPLDFFELQPVTALSAK